MIKRSEKFWLASYYLSKYGEINKDGKAYPPIELNTSKWKEAYRMFYEALGKGRTIDNFEHSLKNARDEFDGHIASSARIGWRTKDREPRPLRGISLNIFRTYSHVSRNVLWSEVKPFTYNYIAGSEGIYNDISAIQDSEGEDVKSKTEGGKKVIITYRYERNASLKNACFKTQGYDCAVCGFNFEDLYGAWGRQFAEIHHLHMLSENHGQKVDTNPETDLIVLCANCHRMVHRKKGVTLTIEELRSKMTRKSMG